MRLHSGVGNYGASCIGDYSPSSTPIVRAHLTDASALRFDQLGIYADDLESVGRVLLDAAKAAGAG
jgi:hypothetical protein